MTATVNKDLTIITPTRLRGRTVPITCNIKAGDEVEIRIENKTTYGVKTKSGNFLQIEKSLVTIK